MRAEELGFDLVFGLAQWLGKGGYGGEMRFRESAADPLLVTAGLAPLTRNIILISTVHVLSCTAGTRCTSPSSPPRSTT